MRWLTLGRKLLPLFAVLAIIVLIADLPSRAAGETFSGPGQPPPRLIQGGNKNSLNVRATVAGDAKSGSTNASGNAGSTPNTTPNNNSTATTNTISPPNPAPCGWNSVQHGSVSLNGGGTALLGTNATPKTCPTPPPPPLTPATSPPPNLAPYYAQIFEEIKTSPGTIFAAPPNHTGLVNLPSCFWLSGQAVPNQTQVTKNLKGPRNAAGKQITYHITLTVTLQSPVSWNFGDGSTTTTQAPTTCLGISGDPPTLVAHNYVNYSNGDFMVTVSETYSGSVTMTWTDDNGPESETLTGPTHTISTDPYPIKVDQEEGVGTG